MQQQVSQPYQRGFPEVLHFSNGRTTASSMNGQKGGILWVTVFSFMHKCFTTNYALLQ